MGASTPAFSKTFLNALQRMGKGRLNLEQVLRAYQETFPSEAMKPDVRQRLHAAIDALVDAGLISIPAGSLDNYQYEELPKIIEFISQPDGDSLNTQR